VKDNRDKPGPAQGMWTREKVKRYLVQRFYTRFHMSLILASSGLAAMLGNWVLLHAGVHVMWVRYPIAVSIAYLTFLAGVWLWLRYVGIGQRSGAGNALVDNADIPNVSVGGGSSGGSSSSVELPAGLGKGGGDFAGGGASGSWAQGNQVPMVAAMQSNAGGAAPSSGTGSSGFGSLGDFGDLDGDAIVLLVIAFVLVASIFLLSGYVIWFAPDILGEAAFGAVLAGGLAKPSQRHDSEGWVAGVVKKTWWPFAIVLGLALGIAIFAAVNYPGARTIGQAISMAVSG
jgi:hypothetical protein